MKSIITTLLGLSAIGYLASCTFVETPEPSTRTTTTDVTPTTYGTVETTTTRTY